MRAIYFRALHMSAAIAFKGSPGVCGHAVNSQILLFSSYLGSIGIAAEEKKKKKKLDSQTRLLTGVFSSSCHANYHFYHIEIRIFHYEIVNFAFLLRGLITMLRDN